MFYHYPALRGRQPSSGGDGSCICCCIANVEPCILAAKQVEAVRCARCASGFCRRGDGGADAGTQARVSYRVHATCPLCRAEIKPPQSVEKTENEESSAPPLPSV